MSTAELYELLQEYIELAIGEKIVQHDEIIELFSISGKQHPHYNFAVGISRRAFKHVIEVRKRDFLRKHNKQTTLELIEFLISVIETTIMNYDEYDLESANKHFYTKEIAGELPKVRILLNQEYDKKLLIQSIHLRKRTKKHHKRGNF